MRARVCLLFVRTFSSRCWLVPNFILSFVQALKKSAREQHTSEKQKAAADKKKMDFVFRTLGGSAAHSVLASPIGSCDFVQAPPYLQQQQQQPPSALADLQHHCHRYRAPVVSEPDDGTDFQPPQHQQPQTSQLPHVSIGGAFSCAALGTPSTAPTSSTTSSASAASALREIDFLPGVSSSPRQRRHFDSKSCAQQEHSPSRASSLPQHGSTSNQHFDQQHHLHFQQQQQQQRFSSLQAPIGLWTQSSSRSATATKPQQSQQKPGESGGGSSASNAAGKNSWLGAGSMMTKTPASPIVALVPFGQQSSPGLGAIMVAQNLNDNHNQRQRQQSSDSEELGGDKPQTPLVTRIGVVSVTGSPGKSAFIHALLRVLHPAAAETGEIAMPVVGKCGSFGTLRNKAYDIDVPFISSPTCSPPFHHAQDVGIRWRLIDTPGRELFPAGDEEKSMSTGREEEAEKQKRLLECERINKMKQRRSARYLESLIRGLKLEQNLTESAEEQLRAKRTAPLSSDDDDDDNVNSSSRAVFDEDLSEALDLIVLVIDARDLVEAVSAAPTTSSSSPTAPTTSRAPSAISTSWFSGLFSSSASGIYGTNRNSSSSRTAAPDVRCRFDSHAVRVMGQVRRLMDAARELLDDRPPLVAVTHADKISSSSSSGGVTANFADVERVVRLALEKDCVPRRHCFVLCCEHNEEEDDGHMCDAEMQAGAELHQTRAGVRVTEIQDDGEHDVSASQPRSNNVFAMSTVLRGSDGDDDEDALDVKATKQAANEQRDDANSNISSKSGRQISGRAAATQFDSWNKLVQALTAYSTSIAVKGMMKKKGDSSSHSSEASSATPTFIHSALLPFGVSSGARKPQRR